MEGMLFLSFIALIFSIIVTALGLVFLYKVPKHLEEISLILAMMYKLSHDNVNDDNPVHPADDVAERINNCETLK